ncbi:MAG: CBS domain-containing protein [Candidatus Methylomirabilis sp.]
MGIAPSEFEDSYEDEQTIRGAILTEPIRGLEPREPVCVRPKTSVRDAIELMNDSGTGCVLVTQGERLVGILTERDVLKKVVGKFDLDNLVERFMTKNPETVGMDDGLAYALNKMHVGGYRHVPVVDKEGRPVGVVSVRDLVKFIVSLFPAAVLNVPPEPGLAARALDGG